MRRYGFLALKVFLATFVLLGSAPMSSYAARDGARPGEMWKSRPVYYEPSGSYFQLVSDMETRRAGIMWHEAAAAASRMSYKGRPGRLAILDDGALYGWILENFRLQDRIYGGDTWIGLRYMCSTRTLMRVSGEEYPPSAFSVWGVPWYRDDSVHCGKGNLQYMGVHIHGKTSRWRAVGDRKAYPHFLVEFPAN
jgi:hypothetical protein